MVALHSGWILSMLLEVWTLEREFSWQLAGPSMILVIIGQGLRYHAILTLGMHWNTKIVLVPGKAALRSGLYRYFRHPNYLGVVLRLLFPFAAFCNLDRHLLLDCQCHSSLIEFVVKKKP